MIGSGPNVVASNADNDSLELYCIDSDTTLLWRSCVLPDSGGSYAINVASGDLDRDGDLEVVAASRCRGVVLVLDGKTKTEVNRIQTGQLLNGASLGNVDTTSDDLQIAISAQKYAGSGQAERHPYVRVYTYSDSIPSYSRAWNTDKNVLTHPLLADFDGGGDIEIIVGMWKPQGFDLSFLGIPSSGDTLDIEYVQPLTPGCPACPAAGDIDQDGKLDVVVLTSDGTLHAFEYWGTGSGAVEWPRFQHDNRHTGLYEQTYSGSLGSDTSWWGDIHIEGDVVVGDSARLFVAPGTNVTVAAWADTQHAGWDTARCELRVEGELYSVGTSQDTIYFQSDAGTPAAGDWYGIVIEPAGTGTLGYMSVSHAYKSVWARSPSGLDLTTSALLNQGVYAVQLDTCDSNTRVQDSRISSAGTGIWASYSDVDFTNLTIVGAKQYGIKLEHDKGSTIANDTIHIADVNPEADLSGIYIAYTDSAVVVRRTAIDTDDAEARGISTYNLTTASASIDSNRLYGTIGSSGDPSKGMRFQASNPVVRWNRLTDYKWSFEVVRSPGYIPDLGDTNTSDGNNCTYTADSLVAYYVYTGLAMGNPGHVRAQNNWWGFASADSSDSSKFWMPTEIDWIPYLTSDPYGGRGRADGNAPDSPIVFAYMLSHNFPNPFNPITTVRYGLAQPGRVTVRIYDIAGRLVKTLVEAEKPAGYYTVPWAGRNDAGQRVASGVYFCRMESGAFRKTRKMVLLK
jgi:hypothetical protein